MRARKISRVSSAKDAMSAGSPAVEPADKPEDDVMSREVGDAIKQARQDIQARCYAKALDRLKGIRRNHSVSSEAAVLLARCAARVGDDALRRELAAEIEARWPLDARALVAAAEGLEKAGDTEGACRLLEAARASGTQASTLRLLFRTYVRLGRQDNALAVALEMSKLDPDNPAHHFTALDILRSIGDLDGFARQAVAASSRHPSVAIEAAIGLIASDDPIRAAIIVREIPMEGRVGPLGAPLLRKLRDLGRRARAAGQLDPQAAAWAAILSLRPDDDEAVRQSRRVATAFRDAAREAVTRESLVEASGYLERALAVAPPSLALLREAAKLAERRADWGSATAMWKRALDEHGDEADDLAQRLTRAALRAGDFGLAIEMRQRAAALAPDDQEAARSLDSAIRRGVSAARQMIAEDKVEDGAIALRRIVSLRPDCAAANRELARLSKQSKARLAAANASGDRSVVEDALKQLLLINPKDFDALKGIARLLEVNGERAKSAAIYEALAATEIGKPSYWAKAIKLYMSAKYYENAIITAKKAVEKFSYHAELTELLAKAIEKGDIRHQGD